MTQPQREREVERRYRVLDEIPFDPDIDALAEQLHVPSDSARRVELRSMVSEAQALAKPKALYRAVSVEARGDDYVVLGRTRFTSRVLSVNLRHLDRVFAFVATCGIELANWAQSQGSPLQRFQTEAIANAALTAARQALRQRLEERFDPGPLSEMNPGSLPDWPLPQQRLLFDLLGDPESAIGVQLLDSYLMKPSKTTSGLLFPAEDDFYNCQLCARENCRGRRANYDPDLYEGKYQGATMSGVSGDGESIGGI